MTTVEWLFNELWNTDKDKFTWHSILKKAKEMEIDNSPKEENRDSFGEISDEEILNEAIEHSNLYINKFTPRNAFIMGAKWYREQLKKK